MSRFRYPKLCDPATPTTTLANSVECHVGHRVTVVHVVARGTQRTAYCSVCRQYVKHLGKLDVIASALVLAPTQAPTSTPNEFYFATKSMREGLGVTTQILGIYPKDPTIVDKMRKCEAVGFKVRLESGLIGKEKASI